MAIFNSYVKLPEGTRERQPFLQGVDDVLSSPGGLFRVARGRVLRIHDSSPYDAKRFYEQWCRSSMWMMIQWWWWWWWWWRWWWWWWWWYEQLRSSPIFESALFFFKRPGTWHPAMRLSYWLSTVHEKGHGNGAMPGTHRNPQMDRSTVDAQHPHFALRCIFGMWVWVNTY